MCTNYFDDNYCDFVNCSGCYPMWKGDEFDGGDCDVFCTDGKQNHGEEEIDCGGACQPCGDPEDSGEGSPFGECVPTYCSYFYIEDSVCNFDNCGGCTDFWTDGVFDGGDCQDTCTDGVQNNYE